MYRFRKIAIATVACAIVAGLIFAATSRISKAGGLSGVQWNQIGPAPLSIDAEQNFQGAGPDSGEVTEIAIDPRGASDQVIYITTNHGGLWKSIDGGSTWFPMTDFQPSLSGGAVALDNGNPSIVYYGTGNAFSNGFDSPAGIFVSTNQGKTWAFAPGSAAFSGQDIIRMVSPAPGVLLVGASNGLWRSPDGGNTFNLIQSGFVSDLKLDTTTANAVLVAFSGVGIFRSTDGGQTLGSNLWTLTNNSPLESPNNPALIGYIAIGQSTMVSGVPNNHTIFVTVQNTGPTMSAPSRFLGMWRSTDLGATWLNIPAAGGVESSPPTTGPGDQDGNAGGGCQCGYDQTVGVDPFDANRVYIGFQQVWRSVNALTTNTSVAFGGTAVTANQVHFDNHALVFSPSTHFTGPAPTPLYTGQDGGIATSADGSTWTNINGPTNTSGVGAIAANLFRGIDIGRGSPSNNAYTYGGTQDTGTIETPSPGPLPTGVTNWHLGIDGDGGPVAVDPGNPLIVIGNDDGGSVRSTDGGATWGGIASLTGSIGAVYFDPIPSDKTAYASSFSTPDTTLFQSMDEGATFTAMHLVPGDVGVGAIGGTPADGNTVWLGLSDGSTTFTNNALLGATATWNNSTVTGAPGFGVSAIAVDPTNPNVVVVAYPGFTGINPNTNPTKHVFRTTDSGATWTDISGTTGGGIQNLPDVPVNSVTIDPNTAPHTIIIGTDVGVFQSADNGNSWQVLGLGMPNVPVTSVQLDANASPEVLRAGTYGRSTFQMEPPSVPLIQVNSNFSFGTLCGSGPFVETLQIFNVGEGDLSISGIARVSGSNDFSLSPPSGPVTVPEGSEIDYNIVFNPTATPGTTETATFQINSNDPFHPAQQVTYTGTPGAPTIATVIAPSGDFGNVCRGSFSDLNLTISNKGACPLDISTISATNPLFTVASVVAFPLVVAPGTGIAVPIRYTPTAITSSPDTANIDIGSSDPVTPTLMVPVQGSSAGGKIAVTGTANFGNVCAENAKQVTFDVNNVGKCDLNVSSVMVNCPDFTVTSDPFPNPISPDSDLDLIVKFTPTSVGMKSCTLTIDSDDPVTPVFTETVMGDTPSPSISLGTAGLTFPPTVIKNRANCHSSLGVPIANSSGTCGLTIDNLVISGPNSNFFSLAGEPNLPVTLGPGQQLGAGDLDAIFTPNSIVSRTNTASIGVTWTDDPITGHMTTNQVPMCGESVSRGVRAIVIANGSPVTSVDTMSLLRVNPPSEDISPLTLIERLHHVPLTTVTGTPPCPSFQYNFEVGTTTQTKSLRGGVYVLVATTHVNGKVKSRAAQFNINTCDFDQNLVLTMP